VRTNAVRRLLVDKGIDVVLDEPSDRRTLTRCMAAQRVMLLLGELDIQLTHYRVHASLPAQYG